MLELLENFIQILTTDAGVTALVPAKDIMVGPVDIVMEKQSELIYPQINLRIISETQRSNPLNTRDTEVGIDIWSRNSQMEIENIYEAVIKALSYETANKGFAHIFWTRLSSSVDVQETDRRIWHRATTFVAWTLK